MRFEEAIGMARRMVSSSFECDCGHQSHFCEGTVRDMEADSRRRHKRMHLLDSEAEEHAIELEEGVATAVIWPKQGRGNLDAQSWRAVAGERRSVGTGKR